MRTISAAFTHYAGLLPDKPFIKSGDAAYTYRESYRAACGLAAYMSDLGMQKGSRACLLLPRTPELVIAMLGMSLSGVLPVPVNYTLSRPEVRRFVEVTKPGLIIVHSKFEGAFEEGYLEHITKKEGVRVVSVGGEFKGAVPWREAASPRSEPPGRTESAPEDVAYLNYTTGTSGMPKGALATHDNIYWNTLASNEALGLTGVDVHLCMFASFAHPHELFARPVYTGGTLVLLEEINPKTIARTITGNNVTAMMGLAPMYDMMATHLRHDLPSLRVAESGGMYTKPALNEAFTKRFGLPILSVWGSTETTGIALANRPERHRTDGSAGVACPHYEVKVLDEEGREVRPGELGELAFKGGGVVSGYFDSPEFRSLDGFYLSGDIGFQDRDGFFYYTERRSGMIKVAGLKVYPLQVELVLAEAPGVREAAVIGYDDRLRGMVPRAFIVRDEGSSLGEEEIKKYCKGRMADYMVPKKIDFVDELPKIGSGKINKKELARKYS